MGLRAWHFLTLRHAMWEAGGSNPGCGIIVGEVFLPTRQLTRFSPSNMPFILRLCRINLHSEAVNYRPCVSPLFMVASHVK